MIFPEASSCTAGCYNNTLNPSGPSLLCFSKGGVPTAFFIRSPVQHLWFPLKALKQFLTAPPFRTPPTSGTERAKGHLDKTQELVCWTLPHSLTPSSFLSVSHVTCRVTALSIKRSMCWLPLNQVDWLLKSYWRSHTSISHSQQQINLNVPAQ